MPGAIVVDKMGLEKTFTSVAAMMICKLVTEYIVMRLTLPIMWGNTHEKWVIVAHNHFPGIVGDEWECHPLQRLHSVPHWRLKIQSTPPHGRLTHISAHD
jgi:hypothetical protein